MPRDWNSTYCRNCFYLGLIDGDMRRRPTRCEHPKTEHGDNQERQLRAARSGKPKLQFWTVRRYYWSGSSYRVCGRSAISHVSLHLISSQQSNIRTAALGLRCLWSHHVIHRVAWERDVGLFLKRWVSTEFGVRPMGN